MLCKLTRSNAALVAIGFLALTALTVAATIAPVLDAIPADQN